MTSIKETQVRSSIGIVRTMPGPSVGRKVTQLAPSWLEWGTLPQAKPGIKGDSKSSDTLEGGGAVRVSVGKADRLGRRGSMVHAV